MNDEKKVNDAINEVNKLVSEGTIQNLSDKQLNELSKTIQEIQEMLEK